MKKELECLSKLEMTMVKGGLPEGPSPTTTTTEHSHQTSDPFYLVIVGLPDVETFGDSIPDGCC